MHTDKCAYKKRTGADVNERANNVDEPVGQEWRDPQEDNVVCQVLLVRLDLLWDSTDP